MPWSSSTITTWASRTSSAASTTSPTPPRQVQIYKAMGWERAGIRARAADPRARRRQAVEAPRRARPSRPTAPWATCRPACATTSCGSAGATATPRSSPPKQAIEWFDIVDINKSPGRLDFAKLGDVNSHYITTRPTTPSCCAASREFLPHLDERRGHWPRKLREGGLGQASPPPCPRSRTGPRPCTTWIDGAAYLIARSGRIALDDKASKLLDAEARATLAKAVTAAGRLCRSGSVPAPGSRRCAAFADERPARSWERSHSPCAPRSPAAAYLRPCSTSWSCWAARRRSARIARPVGGSSIRRTGARRRLQGSLSSCA